MSLAATPFLGNSGSTDAANSMTRLPTLLQTSPAAAWPYRGLVDAERAVVGDDEVFRVGRDGSRQVRATQILLGTGQCHHVLGICRLVVS